LPSWKHEGLPKKRYEFYASGRVSREERREPRRDSDERPSLP